MQKILVFFHPKKQPKHSIALGDAVHVFSNCFFFLGIELILIFFAHRTLEQKSNFMRKKQVKTNLKVLCAKKLIITSHFFTELSIEDVWCGINNKTRKTRLF